MIWLDTQALIYALDGKFKPKTQAIAEHVKRGRKFIRDQQRRGQRIYLCTQTVAEFLTKADDDRQRDQLQQVLRERFVIRGFDMKSARISASLRSEKKKLAAAGKEAQRSSDCIKADLLIYSTAVAYNAKRLISYDTGVIALGKQFGLVEVSEFSGAQGDLFTQDDG